MSKDLSNQVNKKLNLPSEKIVWRVRLSVLRETRDRVMRIAKLNDRTPGKILSKIVEDHYGQITER